MLGRVDYEGLAQGLDTPLGAVFHTGVGALTLNGSLGRLAWKLGHHR